MQVIRFLCMIALVVFLMQPVLAQNKTEAIRLNQIGFYPDGQKLAIVVETTADVFLIATPDLKDTLFTGDLSSPKKWVYSDETVKQADFSEFKTIGTFVVLVPGLGYSAVFDIKPRVHQEVARAATKAFYFQRMSIELTEPFAGKWHRPMGHPDTEVLVHSSAASAERPEGTVLSCPRGWYDAGDYNKYIVNSGISVYTLLAIYEQFPEYCRSLETNIPESGNTIPDVLDECLWNIRWMLSMQDPNDGGVYHKCTHANFSGFVMPHEATAPRYVVQKSSTAALNFAAVMAQTSRIFREFNLEFPGFADSCLVAALSAWNWARNNPDVYYRQNDNNETFLPAITTGEYGDNNDNDEFKWAAAELYITTLQDSFLTAVNPFSDNNTSLPDWRNVATLGFYSLAHHRKNLTAAVDTAALKNRLLAYADEIKTELSNSAYHVLLTTFPWGSNAVAANQSMAMIQAFELTADSSYLEAAIANLDYMLGRNATTYCFVSGQGDKSPMFFHHRPSEADGIDDPVPGLIAGGPNPSQQDNCSGYPSDLPARSYLDDVCSYASNEICINWNSPLAYVAAALEAIKSSTGKANTIAVAITSPSNDDTFNASEVISIAADASITEGSIIKVEFYANQIKLGEANTAPFTFQWENASPGVYNLRAKAWGDLGDFMISPAVEVVVFSSETVGDLLFVVGAVNLNSGDNAVRNFLIQHDYHVVIQDDNDTVAFYTEDKDVILISSTVLSTRKIQTELVNINIPLLSWKNSLFDDFGWTGKRLNIDNGKATGSSVDIALESHAIAAGLSGTVQITYTPQELVWGLPNENADIIAIIAGDAAKAAIFSYETGVNMLNDMVASARRVGFCLSDESAINFTDEGWQLFIKAIEWAKAGDRISGEDDHLRGPITNQLFQNYPNPFNPSTTITYQVPVAGEVTLSIYNLLGQKVAVLVSGKMPSGYYQAAWHAEGFASGIYLYRIETKTFSAQKKMLLLK
jgi:endoglucanase